MNRAEALLDSQRGRAGLIRTLALRGAEEIARDAESETNARSRAVAELLKCDFSRLSDIVDKRESDLVQRLPTASSRLLSAR